MLAPATDFAKAMGLDVTLLMSLARIPEMSPPKAEAYLQQKATALQARSLNAGTKIVPHGDAADVIVAEADANPGTVVALATHGRGGLAKLVWGSVTEDVVRRTKAPVLVFKPPHL